MSKQLWNHVPESAHLLRAWLGKSCSREEQSSVLNTELGFMKLWLSAQLCCEFPFVNRLLHLFVPQFLISKMLPLFLFDHSVCLQRCIQGSLTSRSYCCTTKFLLASTFSEKPLTARFERPAWTGEAKYECKGGFKVLSSLYSKKVAFLKVCALKKTDMKQHIVVYIFLADTLFGQFLL